jgi:hypothetical protein
MSSATADADTLQWKTPFDETPKLLENEQNPFQTATTQFGAMRDWSESPSSHVDSSKLEANIRSSLAFDADEQDSHEYFDSPRGHDADDHWHHDPPSPVPEPSSATLLVIALAILLTFTEPHPHQKAHRSWYPL